jgi:hypothetical protein
MSKREQNPQKHKDLNNLNYNTKSAITSLVSVLSSTFGRNVCLHQLALAYNPSCHLSKRQVTHDIEY